MVSSEKVKSLIEYNQAILPRLSQICEPLELLGVSNFAYVKITKDRKCFRIGTHKGYTELFFKHQMQDQYHTRPIKFSKEKQTKYFLWNSGDHVSADLRVSAGVWNGINIYYMTEDYIEGWAVGGTLHDTQLPNFFLNNIDLLNQFWLYFKTAGKDILDLSDKQKAIDITFSEIVDIPEQVDQQTIAKFNNQVATNKYFLSKGKDLLSLTRRELECLIHKNQGMTAKEIARILNISHRTVESYFDNIKIKSGLNHINQVLSACNAEGLL